MHSRDYKTGGDLFDKHSQIDLDTCLRGSGKEESVLVDHMLVLCGWGRYFAVGGRIIAMAGRGGEYLCDKYYIGRVRWRLQGAQEQNQAAKYQLTGGGAIGFLSAPICDTGGEEYRQGTID